MLLRVIILVLIGLFFSAEAPAGPLPARSLDSLVAATRADPSSKVAAQKLEDSISAGLPTQLSNDWMAGLPVDVTPLPYDLGQLIVPRDYLPTHAEEPQHDWKFAKAAYVYSAGPSSAQLFCTVHYPMTTDGPLALRVAKLLALAHQTLTNHTGQEAFNGTAPFDVWLCRGGQTGGEQWKTNLYLYDIDSPRSSIEWIREITHEYSHLALPAIGGYDAPEYWANGYLGERLIVRWLIRQPDGPARVETIWGDFSGAPNFARLLLTPAQALYKKIGPNTTWLARKDETGMRYLIGQALTFDDKYGSKRLGSAFVRLPRFHVVKAADLAAALSESTLP